MRPVEIMVNGSPREVAGSPTIAQLLAELGLENARLAVALNRAVVPRARHAEVVLQPGDRLEIVQAVQGG
jgi:thiamine biosynthesis protein ThiS